MKQLVLLILKQNNHQVLLAMKKRGFGVGRWNGVGGKVEDGETLEQAVVRECEEEAGITPKNFHKVAVLAFSSIQEGEAMQQEVHVYLGEEWEGEPEETEEMASRWFPMVEIPYEHMWEDDALWLPLVLRGKKLHCSFTFKDDVMSSAHLDIVDDLA